MANMWGQGELGCTLHSDENFPDETQADYSVNFLFSEQAHIVDPPPRPVQTQEPVPAAAAAPTVTKKRKKRTSKEEPPPAAAAAASDSAPTPMELSEKEIIELYRSIQRQATPPKSTDPSQQVKAAFCQEVRKKQALAAHRQKNVDLGSI